MDQSLGEKLIRINCGIQPRNDVELAKQTFAKLIDAVADKAQDDRSAEYAIIKLEETSMWVTKALTT